MEVRFTLWYHKEEKWERYTKGVRNSRSLDQTSLVLRKWVKGQDAVYTCFTTMISY